MEFLVLGAFCASLALCISLGFSMLYALFFGLLLFMLYGRRKGFSWRALAGMAMNGVKTVRGILITFLLIGVMTGLWRAAGTISFIVCRASGLIRPSVFLLMTFLLNSGLSTLTGTSFGTAATMGVICASIGAAMNVSPFLTGGAVLSGAFLGDRCSPVSTSALLVATITETDIFDNLRRMLRRAVVPFLLTCLVYLLLGLSLPREEVKTDLEAVYARVFTLNWITVLPAAAILLLSAFRVKVKAAMCVSVLTAVLICLFVQDMPFIDVLKTAWAGFCPRDAEAAATMSGGGALSMLEVTVIVCVSTAYTDLFNKTGLLDGARNATLALSRRTTVFCATLLSSLGAGMIACNQTLAILLAKQLCQDLYPDKETLAIDLEDTAVVVSPLIPWSIAGAVPLSTVHAPVTAVFAAFYLMILPLYRLVVSMAEKRKELGGRD